MRQGWGLSKERRKSPITARNRDVPLPCKQDTLESPTPGFQHISAWRRGDLGGDLSVSDAAFFFLPFHSISEMISVPVLAPRCPLLSMFRNL